MNRKIRLILFLILISILGVLVFQIVWLRDTYNSHYEAFSQSARDALQLAIEDEMAVETLRNMETVVWHNEKDSTHQETIEIIGDVVINSSNIDSTLMYSSSQLTSTFVFTDSDMKLNMEIIDDTDRNENHFFTKNVTAIHSQGNPVEQTMIIDTDMDENHFFDFRDEAILLDSLNKRMIDADEKLDEMVRNVIIRFGTQQIDVKRLDSLYAVRLADRAIFATYSLSSSEGDNLELDMPKRGSLLFSQPVNRFRNDNTYVYVEFPALSLFVMKQMWMSVAGSFILVAIIIFILVFMLSTILKQKKLAEMKNDFINNMTHEFKTPVAAVSAALEGMESFGVLDDKEKASSYLKMSRNELDRLNTMIENLLHVAQREREGLAIKEDNFDLFPVIGAVVNSIKVNHSDVTFEVVCPEPCRVYADRFHLTNVLNNLVDNAVKYGFSNPDLRVLINAFHHKNNLIIEVSDNGPGIPLQYHKYLFDKFYRVPTGNVHNVKGFGLGLNYVAAVVAAHNGSVEVESTVGQGTVFTVKIPEENA